MIEPSSWVTEIRHGKSPVVGRCVNVTPVDSLQPFAKLAGELEESMLVWTRSES